MNIPNVGGLLLDEEILQIQQEIESKGEVVASLDAEIALILAASERLMQKRNKVHSLLAEHPPGGFEANKIRATVSEMEDEFNALQGRVTSARQEFSACLNASTENSASCDADAERRLSVLNQLVHDRDEARDTLQRRCTELSPALRLPPEILGEIFLRCIPVDEHFAQPSPVLAPMLLANICNLWRSITLATPELWSTISVKFDDLTINPAEDLIKLWISRSGSRPLSLKVLGNKRNDDRESENRPSPAASLLSIFVPHHARWRNIHFAYRRWGVGTGLHHITDDAVFPLLESAHLERTGWFDQEDVIRVANMFLAAPLLHKVSWISLTGYADIRIPWGQITLLNLIGSRPPLLECLDIIQACPYLVTATFAINLTHTHHDEHNPSEVTLFVHTKLERLKLLIHGDLGLLFRSLTLPHLKELSVDVNYFEPFPHFERSWHQAHMTKFITRSQCLLESLSLTSADILPEEMIELLQSVSSSLQTLTVSAVGTAHTCFTDKIIRSLTCMSSQLLPDGERLPLCPTLIQLYLYGCLSSTDGVLADMIESRWGPRSANCAVAELDVVLVTLKGALHPNDILRAARLGDQSRIRIIPL